MYLFRHLEGLKLNQEYPQEWTLGVVDLTFQETDEELKSYLHLDQWSVINGLKK